MMILRFSSQDDVSYRLTKTIVTILDHSLHALLRLNESETRAISHVSYLIVRYNRCHCQREKRVDKRSATLSETWQLRP